MVSAMAPDQPPTVEAAPAAPPRRAWAALNAGSLGVAIGFGATAAVLFSPIFMVSFPVLLGRTLFVSMVLLLVFVAAQRIPEARLPTWLPRWLFTMLALSLAAPISTFAVYLISVGGSVSSFLGNEGRITGFVVIAATSLVLALLITLTAQLREREAQARSQALQFELERSRLEKQAVDARLALLQTQIEPHFLFNTLANVQALVESNSPRAPEVLKSLIAYLRAAMPRLKDKAPTLGNELALAKAYLELMQMRMADRLAFSIEVDPELAEQRFPPLALMTLVENAVRHGIDPSETGGRIDIGADQGPQGWRVWVQDSGAGLSEHAEPGTGLTNLRARIAAFFGAGAALNLSDAKPHGLRAEISWPS